MFHFKDNNIGVGNAAYSPIFKILYPELIACGLTDEEFHLLISINPSKVYALEIINQTSAENAD